MAEKSEKQKSLEQLAKVDLSLEYKGRIISAYKETLHFPDGSIATKDKVTHPGAVAILPIDEQGHILFIKQWRRSIGSILIEIPAGTLEMNETPIECAHREIQEEIGFASNSLISLGGFYTAPGFCDEYIHLFLAQDLFPSALWADDTDYIDLFALSLEEALDLVSKGAFLDSKTLSALTLYQLWLKKLNA